MKAEILKMLREADGYISGQEICEKFNVSRTAVWKVIRRLQEDGYEVEAVRNKGYRMVESPDILTKEEVEAAIDALGKGASVRGETLTLEEFARLSDLLSPYKKG